MSLPYSYNVQPTRWKRPPPVHNASSIVIMHFIGDPKPWKELPPRGKLRKENIGWHVTASKLWTEACKVMTPGADPAESSGQMNRLATQLLGQRWK